MNDRRQLTSITESFVQSKRGKHEDDVDGEHLTFLEWLSKAQSGVIYVLPRFLMDILQLRRDQNLFQAYEMLMPCSNDVLQQILMWRDHFDTGTMNIHVGVSGAANEKVLRQVESTEPRNFITAIVDESIEFYAFDSILRLKEVDGLYSCNNKNFGVYRVVLPWIRKKFLSE